MKSYLNQPNKKVTIEAIDVSTTGKIEWIPLIGLILIGVLVFWGVISIPVYLVSKVLGG